MEYLEMKIFGDVQGVGFRYEAKRVADALGLEPISKVCFTPRFQICSRSVRRDEEGVVDATPTMPQRSGAGT